MELVSIHDDETYYFVRNMTIYTWIGMHKRCVKKDLFEWSDGSACTPEWEPKWRDADCLIPDPQKDVFVSLRWDGLRTLGGDDRRPFICADPHNDPECPGTVGGGHEHCSDDSENPITPFPSPTITTTSPTPQLVPTKVGILGNRTFKYFCDARTWTQARAHCQSINMELAAIHDNETYHFFRSLDTNSWIGLYKPCNPTDVFTYSDGSLCDGNDWDFNHAWGEPMQNEERGQFVAMRWDGLEGESSQEMIPFVCADPDESCSGSVDGGPPVCTESPSMAPTTTSHPTGVPITQMPSTFSPTMSPVTLHPHSEAPSVSPLTLAPSASPTQSPFTGAPFADSGQFVPVRTSTLNGRDFYYFQQPMPWPNAREYCQGIGMELVSIHDDETYAFIRSRLTTYAWIGFHRPCHEGTVFEWSDGSSQDCSYKWEIPWEHEKELRGEYAAMRLGGFQDVNVPYALLPFICADPFDEPTCPGSVGGSSEDCLERTENSYSPLRASSKPGETGRDFFYFQETMTWPDARKHCHSIGMELATAHDDETYELLRSLSTFAWIGLYRPCHDEYAFEWADGTSNNCSINWELPWSMQDFIYGQFVALRDEGFEDVWEPNAALPFICADPSDLPGCEGSVGGGPELCNKPTMSPTQTPTVISPTTEPSRHPTSTQSPTITRGPTMQPTFLLSRCDLDATHAGAKQCMNLCDGRQMELYTYKKTWHDANEFCRSRGKELYSPSTHHLNDALIKFLDFYPASECTEDEMYWIGLNDVDSDLKWTFADGDCLGYTNWAPAEPSVAESLQCGFIYGPPAPDNEHWTPDFVGLWDNDFCSREHRFVCVSPLEYPPCAQVNLTLSPTESKMNTSSPTVSTTELHPIHETYAPTLTPTTAPTINITEPTSPIETDGGDESPEYGTDPDDASFYAPIVAGSVTSFCVLGVIIVCNRRKDDGEEELNEQNMWQFGDILKTEKLEKKELTRSKGPNRPLCVDIFRILKKNKFRKWTTILSNFHNGALLNDTSRSELVEERRMWKYVLEDFLKKKFAPEGDVQVFFQDGQPQSFKALILEEITKTLSTIDTDVIIHNHDKKQNSDVDKECLISLAVLQNGCETGLSDHAYRLMGIYFTQVIDRIITDLIPNYSISSMPMTDPMWEGIYSVISLALRFICTRHRDQIFELRVCRDGFESRKLISKVTQLLKNPNILAALERTQKVTAEVEGKEDLMKSRFKILHAYRKVFFALQRISARATKLLKRKGNHKMKNVFHSDPENEKEFLRLCNGLSETHEFFGEDIKIRGALKESFQNAESTIILEITPRAAAMREKKNGTEFKDVKVPSMYATDTESRAEINSPGATFVKMQSYAETTTSLRNGYPRSGSIRERVDSRSMGMLTSQCTMSSRTGGNDNKKCENARSRSSEQKTMIELAPPGQRTRKSSKNSSDGSHAPSIAPLRIAEDERNSKQSAECHNSDSKNAHNHDDAEPNTGRSESSQSTVGLEDENDDLNVMTI